MDVGDAKREVNRGNALKGTGPKTAEGEDRSRRDAIKHGLTSSVVVAEGPGTSQARNDPMSWDLEPRTARPGDDIDRMILLSLRIDRARRIERRPRDEVAPRAMIPRRDACPRPARSWAPIPTGRTLAGPLPDHIPDVVDEGKSTEARRRDNRKVPTKTGVDGMRRHGITLGAQNKATI